MSSQKATHSNKNLRESMHSSLRSPLQRLLQRQLHRFRERAADERALIPLSLLGIAAGLLTGAVILCFRLVIELPLSYLLPDHNPENFEALSLGLRFALPVTGAAILGLVLQRIFRQSFRVGVVHVIERLTIHHGILPAKNALVQFLTGSFAIITGQSAGREGPAIHLGSAASSLLGQYWRLPNNSIRVMVGCGAAAAIGASFNTPIAGVIFAMEVVMMEYTLAGFFPIILAAFSGTALTQLVYGSDPAFAVPPVELRSMSTLPFLIALGGLIGSVAAAFMIVMRFAMQLNNMAFWLRMIIAGLITGGLAIVVPQLMGIGYDSLSQALSGQLSLQLLIILATAKLIATASSVGLGMPIGLIGPTLLIGACIGGAAGMIGNHLVPSLATTESLYVMLGMGAMMGAVLNAPMAALMALLELTHNTKIIMPGMLTIVAATLTTSEIFKQRSAHQTVLHYIGSIGQYSALNHALARVGVTAVMTADVPKIAPKQSAASLQQLLTAAPRWIVVDNSNQDLRLFSGFALNNAWQQFENETDQEADIDILALGGESKRLASLSFQANLHEAWELMNKEAVDAVYVQGTIAPYTPLISGVVTREDIETYYSNPH